MSLVGANVNKVASFKTRLVTAAPDERSFAFQEKELVLLWMGVQRGVSLRLEFHDSHCIVRTTVIFGKGEPRSHSSKAFFGNYRGRDLFDVLL